MIKNFQKVFVSHFSYITFYKIIRKFGITIGIALGLLAGFLWWKGRDTYVIFISVSIIFIILGLALPTVLKPLQKAWMMLAVVLGWFMTRVILSVLFYLVFTSIGLLSRAFGNKFLDLKMDSVKESNWNYRKSKPFNRSNYDRQF